MEWEGAEGEGEGERWQGKEGREWKCIGKCQGMRSSGGGGTGGGGGGRGDDDGGGGGRKGLVSR